MHARSCRTYTPDQAHASSPPRVDASCGKQCKRASRSLADRGHVWFVTLIATLYLTFLAKVSYSIRTTNLRHSGVQLATNQTSPLLRLHPVAATIEPTAAGSQGRRRTFYVTARYAAAPGRPAGTACNKAATAIAEEKCMAPRKAPGGSGKAHALNSTMPGAEGGGSRAAQALTSLRIE
jgi:hypothetical protein